MNFRLLQLDDCIQKMRAAYATMKDDQNQNGIIQLMIKEIHMFVLHDCTQMGTLCGLLSLDVSVSTSMILFFYENEVQSIHQNKNSNWHVVMTLLVDSRDPYMSNKYRIQLILISSLVDSCLCFTNLQLKIH